MTDDTGIFLVNAGKVAWKVNEGYERNIESIAVTYKAGSFIGRIDIQDPGEYHGLVGHKPNGLSVEPCEAYHDIRGPEFMYFKEIGIVANRFYDIPDIVGLHMVDREDLVDLVLP